MKNYRSTITLGACLLLCGIAAKAEISANVSEFVSDETTSNTLLFYDDFSGDLSAWIDVRGNDWRIDQGTLYGYYSITCGSTTCPQADLILKDEFQPAGDYRASVDFTYNIDPGSPSFRTSQAGFALWSSSSRKAVMYVGGAGWNNWGGTQEQVRIYRAEWSGSWVGRGSELFSYNWNTEEWHTATIERRGSKYRLFINGVFLDELEDSFLGGQGKIGFHTYGAMRLDNFRLESLCQPIPEASFHVDAVEITQSIQNLENDVELVAGKTALVRVYVSNPSTPDRETIRVSVTVESGLNSQYQETDITPKEDAVLRRSGLDSLLGSTADFKVQGEILKGESVSVTVRLMTADSRELPVCFTSDYTQGEVTEVTVTRPLWTIPDMTFRPVGFVNKKNAWETDKSDLEKVYKNMKVLPLPDTEFLDIRPSLGELSVSLPNPGTFTFGRYLNKLLGFRKKEAQNNPSYQDSWIYIGVIPDVGADGGIADGIGSRTCLTYPALSVAHELGHCFGRKHTATFKFSDQCWSLELFPDIGYPYNGGIIDDVVGVRETFWGWGDFSTAQVFRGLKSPEDQYYDIMSYVCDRWISDYTYTRIIGHIKGNYGSSSAVLASSGVLSGHGDSLFITAFKDLSTGAGEVTTCTWFDSPALASTNCGPERIVYRDNKGALLAEYCAESQVSCCGDTNLVSIAQDFPWTNGIAAVEWVSDGVVLDTWLLSTNFPQVTIDSVVKSFSGEEHYVLNWTASDADGDSLTFDVAFSADGDSAPWEFVGYQETNTQFVIPVSSLPMTTSGVFEVTADDGTYRTSDRWAGVVEVSNLVVDIFIPEEDLLQTTFGLQQVTACARVIAPNGTVIDYSNMVWRTISGGIKTLGVGSCLDYPAAELREGTNIIMVAYANPYGDSVTSFITVVNTYDNDGDYMPDAYEIANGLDPFSPYGSDGAYADKDGDGMRNYEEYIAGTHPTNAAAFLFTRATKGDGNSIVIEWDANASRRYQIFGKENLMDSDWSEVSPEITPPTNGVIQVEPNPPEEFNPLYFRLEVWRP